MSQKAISPHISEARRVKLACYLYDKNYLTVPSVLKGMNTVSYCGPVIVVKVCFLFFFVAALLCVDVGLCKMGYTLAHF